MTSWATISTVTPWSAQIRRSARPPTPGWGGRGCRGARRGGGARGRRTRAWAISSRCCSPPETWPIGPVGVGAGPHQLDDLVDPWRRAAPARSSRSPPGGARPTGRRRCPAGPRRSPRTRMPGVEVPSLRAGSRCPRPASPGGRPRTVAVPSDRGSTPRAALTRVDLPTPLGPRTATNSPAATSGRRRTRWSGRPAGRRRPGTTPPGPGRGRRVVDGRGGAVGGRGGGHGAASGQRRTRCPELADLPGLVGGRRPAAGSR